MHSPTYTHTDGGGGRERESEKERARKRERERERCIYYLQRAFIEPVLSSARSSSTRQDVSKHRHSRAFTIRHTLSTLLDPGRQCHKSNFPRSCSNALAAHERGHAAPPPTSCHRMSFMEPISSNKTRSPVTRKELSRDT